ncbi:hypothetical protein HY745_01245 [Candidatus Desantisbacteria bacterium]|nr:hypothetical protein [Candidatus Desantisbacteria bacterium]
MRFIPDRISEAIKISLYPNFVSMELVIMPAFKSDNLPLSDKFIFFDPFADIKNKTTQNPDKKIKDIETGLRIFHQTVAGDISFYFYKGFYHVPGIKTYNSTNVTYFYPELNVYGASYQINSLGGVVSVEAGYYDSREDKKGSDPFIDNSKYKYLLGYGRQINENLHLGAQYYSEIMSDYQKYKNNPVPGFPLEHETRQTVTLRLTQFLKYETWKLSLFGFYGITEKDYMLIPEISYKMTDDLMLTAGGNFIEGDKNYTTFGQFQKNDNVYMRVKYNF